MQLTPPCGVQTLWQRLLAAGRSEPLALGPPTKQWQPDRQTSQTRIARVQSDRCRDVPRPQLSYLAIAQNATSNAYFEEA
jgi:hypothetical protein